MRRLIALRLALRGLRTTDLRYVVGYDEAVKRAVTAERELAQLKAAVDRVRTVHHLIEWVSLSDVCGSHHWFRTTGPTAEHIAVADVCADCRPRRYMNCVCAEDPCPVLVALDQPEEPPCLTT